MPRKKFTLSIDEELTEAMKIQAVRERRDVSTITEGLYHGYLDGIRKRLEAMEARKKKRKP
jgi:hypothetical protein